MFTLSSIFQECMLTKIAGIHFMNAPNFMDKLMMLLKPFLSKNLLEMIQVHQTGSTTLYDIIPREALPKEEGGKYKDHITLRGKKIIICIRREEMNVDWTRHYYYIIYSICKKAQ